MIKPIAHFQVAFGFFTKVWPVYNYSFGNEFHLHVNEMSTRTHFEKGAKGSTEISEKICESEVDLLTGYSEMACVTFSNCKIWSWVTGVMA